MKLEQSFRVAAPVDEVWRALVDVERVAPCLPGAEVTEADEDGTYRGAFTVKLGPTTVVYAGTLKLEELDEASHTAVMSARGTDRRGQGGATATIRSTVREDDGETAVDVVTDYAITGRLARFGRGGMIEDVSRRLLREFAACLQASVGAGAAPGAVAEPSGAGEPSAAARGPAEPSAGAVPSAAAPPTAAPPGTAPPQARPLDAGRLGAGVLWDRLRRWWAQLGRRLRGRKD